MRYFPLFFFVPVPLLFPFFYDLDPSGRVRCCSWLLGHHPLCDLVWVEGTLTFFKHIFFLLVGARFFFFIRTYLQMSVSFSLRLQQLP
jgi:hypothetical protein